MPTGEVGHQLEYVVTALLEALVDKNEGVSRSVSNSLVVVGKSQPDLVLTSCLAFCHKNRKMPVNHKVLLLNVMERVCSESMNGLHKALVIEIIKLATDEMTSAKEVVPDWQGSASGLLVTLGHRFMEEVMEQLNMKFQPGVLPHIFTVQTLANLSTANVFAMVPYLKAILGTMLPMLGMIKQENMKLAFSYALARFAESITEYLSNLENAPDPTVRKEVFSTELGNAYDVLFSSWLQSREPKVRAEVVEALGHMTHLLTKEKMEDQLQRVIPGILALYKRQLDALPVTEGLCMVLAAAVDTQSASLEAQLDSILNTLFPQVCGLPDYSQPSSVKNHNEVLRCFTVLMSQHNTIICDRLVMFILQRLENNNERNRIGALTVLRHLINSSDLQISEKIPAIVSTLKITVSDPNNKVKKVLAQVIVALAHHGHLELEGCESLVSFLVAQCALPDDSGRRPTATEPDYVSNDALRAMCDNVLNLLTTTVEKMEKVLWPYLLECLVPEDLTPAAGVLCKSIAHLAIKKREEKNPDFDIDFAKTNVPKPPVLLSRLIVLLGHPLSGNGRGIHIIRCLKSISPLIDKSLTALWDTLCPQLMQKLEGLREGLNPEPPPTWDQPAWEESIVQFVARSLEEIDREDWTLKFGKALLSHLPLYNNNSKDKCILLRVLGIVLKRIANKQFVNSALDTIFEGVQHSNPLEREGCAIAAGYCGASHLDAVLVKLEQVVKDDQKKNSGLLSFIMDLRGDSDQDRLKATVILTYGHLSAHAPAPILTTRIETPMLRSVANFCQSSKELCVRQSMLDTVRLMAVSLHPDQLKQQFVFPSRNELLLQMQSILKAEGSTHLNSNIRCLALKATASLLALDPVLGVQDKTVLIQTCVSSVYPLPSESREEGEELEDYGPLLNATLESLDALLQQILVKERTTENLNFIIKVLKPWLMSHQDHERDRCIESVLRLLQLFLQKQDNASFAVFTTLGSVLGMLLPRCTDPKASVRGIALLCIKTVMVIMGKGQYQSSDHDSILASLKDLEKLTVHDDPSSLFTITNELAKVMCKKVSLEQLAPLLEMLTEALSDNHSLSSSGASVILNGIVKSRGNELRAEVPHLVESLQRQLESVTCAQTRLGTLCILRSLAAHHLSPLITTLLNSSLPFAKQVVESWREVSREPGLGRNIMEHLLDILSEEQLIESLSDARTNKTTISVAALHPLSAICALREVFRVAEMEVHCKEHFDRIFSSLILVTGTYVGAYQPADPSFNDRKDSTMARLFIEKSSSKFMPVRCAIETFKSFLLCSRQDVIVNFLTENGYWIIMEDEERYPEAMAALARSVCSHWPHQVPRIVSNLNSALNSPYEAQRVTTIAFFSELLAQSYEGNQVLTEPLVNSLLSHLVDSSKHVRRLCIKGLGCMGNLEKDEVHRYSTTVLSAMMAGMDDKDDPEQDITLEAMSGLSSVLAQVDEEDVRDILVNIALRIRPMFDKEKAPVRAAAFTLFGNLSRFGSGPSKESFSEQVQSNLVTLLVYLNDDNQSVVKSCKHALRQVGPLLGSPAASNMFQKHLLDKAQLHYGEFIRDLTKTFVADFPEKISFYVNYALPYLKSHRPVIQCNAAILLGFLLGNSHGDKQAQASKEKVCSMLVVMLRDTTPEVRMKAAEALSLLL